MSIKSNLYAEKIYGDHPTVLWALDDTVDYVDALPTAYKNLDTWTITNGTKTDITGNQNYIPPIPSSSLTLINGVAPTGSGQTVLEGPGIASYTEHSVAVGCHVFIESIYISNIEIGIKVDSGAVQYKEYPIGTEFEEWVFVSETFDLGSTSSKTITPYIRITYLESQSSDSYAVTLNGYSVGYESEEFSYTSTGITEKQSLSSITSLGAGVYGIPADAYGLSADSGYYIYENSWALASKNSSIPMVFGASNSTIVSNNGTLPGLVFPGKGFLSEKGKNSSYTIEGWLRINANHNSSYERILGPISTSDGLYVNKQFLMLSIGNKFEAHYVGEWSRPMLIQITYTPQESSLIVNGEKVLTLTLDDSDKAFTEYSALDDWIGVYSNGSVKSVEVDCVAIYPYVVSETVAKRRFVFGQGIEYPQGINTAYAGATMATDYATANYAKNYSYPDIANWDQGIHDNLYVDSRIISAPQYTIPELVSNDYTSLSNFEQTHSDLDAGFSFRKPGDKATKSGYFRIESLPSFSGGLPAIYMSVLRDITQYSVPQTLFSLNSKNSLGKIEIVLDQNMVKPYYTSPSGETAQFLPYVVLSESLLNVSVLIDLEKMMNSTENESIKQMLLDYAGLQAIIGDTEDFSSTFSGDIVEFGILSRRELTRSSLSVSGSGFSATNSDMSYGTTPSYGLFLNTVINKRIIDIRLHGYWEDYVPLSYFAKTVYHDANETDPYRTVDFLQFNIDHEDVSVFDGSDYDMTGWNVVSSVSFIDISQAGFSVSGESVPTIVEMPANGVVKPLAGWVDKEYRVVNSAVIYPPTDLDIDLLGMVIKINLNVDGIRATPAKIRNLHISSQALNDVLPNSIGSKFGVKVYPYTEDQNGQIDYKAENPFSVSKVSAPYLHLGKKSGISSLGTHDINIDRGLAIKVNEAGSDFFTIGTIQATVRSNAQAFSQTAVNMFEIHTKVGTIQINAIATDSLGERAYLYAEKDGVPFKDVVFFINGNRVGTPVITINEWAMIGMAFTTLLEFGSFTGLIKFSGQVTLNSLSYFQVAEYQKGYVIQNISWNLTKFSNTEPPVTLTWADSATKNWSDAYQTTKPTISGISPEDVYNIYIGTNRMMLTGSTAALTFKDYEYNLYRDITWQSRVVSAV